MLRITNKKLKIRDERPLPGMTWMQRRRERRKPDRIYVSPEGESIMDNLVNRHTRPYNEFRKLLRKELGASIKLRWSQYAGCTCPCSPGFIVVDRRLDPSGEPADMFVTVKMEGDQDDR